ncbi:MAG TPA: hypothetical protein VHA52_08470 [Candidatus Babeliaceae bacterium]|nr:hypothetical protein [Candidatus Babeliaceae bacterium]
MATLVHDFLQPIRYLTGHTHRNGKNPGKKLLSVALRTGVAAGAYFAFDKAIAYIPKKYFLPQIGGTALGLVSAYFLGSDSMAATLMVWFPLKAWKGYSSHSSLPGYRMSLQMAKDITCCVAGLVILGLDYKTRKAEKEGLSWYIHNRITGER